MNLRQDVMLTDAACVALGIRLHTKGVVKALPGLVYLFDYRREVECTPNMIHNFP